MAKALMNLHFPKASSRFIVLLDQGRETGVWQAGWEGVEVGGGGQE